MRANKVRCVDKCMEIQQLGGKAGVRDTDKGFKGVFQFGDGSGANNIIWNRFVSNRNTAHYWNSGVILFRAAFDRFGHALAIFLIA